MPIQNENKTRSYKSLIGNKHALGYKHTEETRRKMSEQRLGKKKPPFTLEHREKMRQVRLGKKASAETRRKLSLARIGNKNNKGRKGEKNHSWKGGRWGYFRKQVLLRDNYTCAICSFREVDIMEVDHILPKRYYPELRFDMNNLQVLCPICHKRKTIKEAKKHD